MGVRYGALLRRAIAPRCVKDWWRSDFVALLTAAPANSVQGVRTRIGGQGGAWVRSSPMAAHGSRSVDSSARMAG